MRKILQAVARVFRRKPIAGTKKTRSQPEPTNVSILARILDIGCGNVQKWPGRAHPKGFNRYVPHQGKQEIARRAGRGW